MRPHGPGRRWLYRAVAARRGASWLDRTAQRSRYKNHELNQLLVLFIISKSNSDKYLKAWQNLCVFCRFLMDAPCFCLPTLHSWKEKFASFSDLKEMQRKGALLPKSKKIKDDGTERGGLEPFLFYHVSRRVICDCAQCADEEHEAGWQWGREL